MYNEFIKKIIAKIDDNTDYKSQVESQNFSIIYNNKNLSDKIRAAISANEDLDGDLLVLVANDKVAALQYMGKDPSKSKTRRNDILRINSALPFAFVKDVDYALYYIIDVLHYQLDLDPDFINEFFNNLSKNPDWIPSVLYMLPYKPETQEFYGKLISYIIKFYSDNISLLKESSTLFDEFTQALEHRNLLKTLFNNNAIFRDLCRKFYTQLGINDNSDNSKKEDGSIININDLSKLFDNQEDLKTVIKFIVEFSNIINSTNQKNDIKTYINSNEKLSDGILNSFITENKDKLRSLINDNAKAQELISSLNDSTINNLNELLNKIKSNLKVSNINRGKKMFRLSKAYTRYYIKNVLAYKVKANNNPEVLPQVIKVSTDEIQDLMYGDSIKHPENLSEIQNPEAKKQIFNDVEDAVEKISKGDLLEDGAADGMSIEDLAKKWAPMYNMQYEQMLDILKTQEQAGSIVEQEHTDNLEIAKEIARDHLTEAPDYYTHLENMESLFPDENVSVKPLMEPENMDLKTVSPQPEDSDHVCDGSCGGNCKCNDKVKTVEDKIQDLSGDGIMVVMVSDSPEVIEEQPLDFIQQIAAKMKE